MPSVDSNEAPLAALVLPFTSGQLAWPAGPKLFLGARDGWSLRALDLDGLVGEQGYKPLAAALERAGIPAFADLDTAPAHAGKTWPLVLVLPPRQREEARALMARAIELAGNGGIVVVAIANNEGARSGEDDLKALAGLAGSITKHHCRVFWTQPQAGQHDTALLAKWRGGDAERQVLGGQLWSRPGVFAWDRIDPASALLASLLPDDLAGHGADLGAGHGVLSLEVLARCPAVTGIDLFEAQARAIELAKKNLAPYATRAKLGFYWHDVAMGLPGEYDFIVTNPPFHAAGRADRPELGQTFIQVASQALRPGGRLWMVANRHLPYEDVLNSAFGTVRVMGEADGFKIIEAVKAEARPAAKAVRPARVKPESRNAWKR